MMAENVKIANPAADVRPGPAAIWAMRRSGFAAAWDAHAPAQRNFLT